ncbi:MAG: protein kinase [Planctomycetes bacterium]|nr:protein kinase [Planctomycetota bacterium]
MPLDDDAFLDAWLDRALRERAEGRELDLAEALAERPALESELGRLQQFAGTIAVVAAERTPLVPGYELLAEIGRGATGVVYLARQRELGRSVALKLLAPAIGASPRGRSRFRSEARAIAKLAHPHVVRVHEIIERDGLLAFAMEWIDGGSLAHVIEGLAENLRTATTRDVHALLGGTNDGPEEPYLVFACRTLAAIARAVHTAHEQGLVHRDLKPSNILLRRDGTALLADFGLAHDAEQSLGTESGSFLGTAAFAAPEQLRAARGEDFEPDARSDVYALGATLDAALRGAPSFRSRDPLGVLHELERGFPPLRSARPDLPRELATIVAVATEPEPARRYPTAAAFAEDLERFLAFRPIAARPPSVARKLQLRWTRHRRAIALGALLVAVTLAASSVVGGELWRQREEERARPERIAEALRLARLALLDARSGERAYVLVHGITGGLEAPAAQLGDALAHYDRALQLAPEDHALRAERELVAAHSQRREISSVRPVFLDGLRHYLRGEHAQCIEAWRELDIAQDPFVEAALGQVHLQRDEADLAYPRLLVAAREFPRAGFLWVELADAAQRVGDVERALAWLAHARAVGGLDPFETDARVEAECLARQGEHERARALFEHMRKQHRAPNARRRYALYLEDRGELEEAAVVAFEAWELGPRSKPFRTAVMRIHERWWADLDIRNREDALLPMFQGRSDQCERIAEVIALLRKNRESTTRAASFASPAVQRLSLREHTLIAEVASMLLSSRPSPSSARAPELARWAIGWNGRFHGTTWRLVGSVFLASLTIATTPKPTYAQGAWVLETQIQLNSHFQGSLVATSLEYLPDRGTLIVGVGNTSGLGNSGGDFAEFTTSGSLLRTIRLSPRNVFPNGFAIDNGGLSIDAGGNLWYVNGLLSTPNENLYRFELSGTVSAIIGPNPIIEATAMAIDPAQGDFLVVQYSPATRIQSLTRLDRTTGAVLANTALPTGIIGPGDAGLAYNPLTGSFAIAGEFAPLDGIIHSMDPTGTTLTPYFNTGLTQGISGIAFDGPGQRMFVLSRGTTNTISIYRISAATATTIGAGCTGSSGIPILSPHSAPTLGNPTFGLRLDLALPGATAILLLSSGQLPLSWGGPCTSYPAPPWLSLTMPVTASGDALLPLPVPNAPFFLGASLVGQFLVIDPAGAFPVAPGVGIAFSNALQITVG